MRLYPAAALATKMKMIFTAPSVVPCDMLKGILESQGIHCMIKNEPTSTVGLGDPVPWMPSLAFSWPELWVNDEDASRAAEIVKDFQPADTQTEEEQK